MKFWKEDSADSEKTKKQVADSYKIKDPEKIQGYGGYFTFHFAKIMIDDKVEEILKNDPKFEDTLNELMSRFRRNDYGNITQKEKDVNMQERFFWCSGVGMVARYDTQYGVITFVTTSDSTEITLN